MNQTRNQKRAIYVTQSRLWTRTCILIFLAGMLFSLSSFAQECQKSKDQSSLIKNLNQLSWEGNLEQISKVIDENPKLLNTRLKNEETLLTVASWQGNIEVAEYLVKKGIDVNLKNQWDNGALHNAAMQGYTGIASLLLKNGAELDGPGNSGNTSLNLAVEKNQSQMVNLLIKAGSDPNAADDYNQTPLLKASWEGNPEIIAALVNAGADVNYSAVSNNTILHNLAAKGNVKSIMIVLDKGADANQADEDGCLPIHLAVMNRNADAVSILQKTTQNINLPENHLGNTPLHIAAINGDLNSTEILLTAGADPNIRNLSGKKAVDYAVQYGYADLVDHYISQNLASKQNQKALAENKAKVLMSLGTDEAKVVYCGHSGWVVETKNHFLVFDYWSRAHNGNGSLVNGTISPEEIRDKNVIVFASHDHSDHYDPAAIHPWAGKIKNIQYVYGFQPDKTWDDKEKEYTGPAYQYINEGEQKEVDGVKVTAFKSTDSGEGFLVEADGITIYHPGDHAWFAKEDEEAFKKEVDFVAGEVPKIDIAFLPVSGCPSRWEKEFVLAGFMYTLDKLEPSQVYPMHALQMEYTLKEFAELAAERKSQSQIVCSENMGDNYLFSKSMVAVK